MNLNFELVAARAKDPVAASRAYALLSVAMYDAAVAAWNAKYRYDREPPSDVDALVDPGPDPSYPSEHAVIAGAASRVLGYLYPERPAASYHAMAIDIARSRVEAGASFPSDQFRPPPFPEYGSPEFLAETQAVIDAKDNLTPEQLARRCAAPVEDRHAQRIMAGSDVVQRGPGGDPVARALVL